MGEALIDLVHQYPALWDKQDAMYKDSNYKEARWKEIAEILHLEGGTSRFLFLSHLKNVV